MKILILSDLHMDINFNWTGIDILPYVIKEIKVRKADLIIIAGDITDFADQSLKVIEKIEQATGVKVLFVPGNHDIWTDEGESSWDAYELFASHSSTLIKKPYILNDDYAVIGDMGWYDYSFAPENVSHYTIRSRKKTLWRDAKLARWGMEDGDVFLRSLEQMEQQLKEHEDKKIIFVNHFIPYKDFLTFKAGDAHWNLCNAFMGSENLGWVLDQYSNIEYVVFGHTHKRFGKMGDYRGKTIICNPLGYSGEWKTDDIEKELKDIITEIQI